MNVERTCTQRRVCIGKDKKSEHILNRWYADKSLKPSDRYHDNTIIPIVLATLDVLFGRANLGTIFRQEEILSTGEKILYSSP